MWAFHAWVAVPLHVSSYDFGTANGEYQRLHGKDGEQKRTLKNRVSSPFLMRFSQSCSACFRFCPSMASWICLLRRWKTASLEADMTQAININTKRLNPRKLPRSRSSCSRNNRRSGEGQEGEDAARHTARHTRAGRRETGDGAKCSMGKGKGKA